MTTPTQIGSDGVVETLRSAYRGTKSPYGRECLKLTAAVLAKQIDKATFDAELAKLDARFGK